MINKLGLKRHEQLYIIFALCAFVIPRIIDCIINKLLKMGEFHTLLPAGDWSCLFLAYRRKKLVGLVGCFIDAIRWGILF